MLHIIFKHLLCLYELITACDLKLSIKKSKLWAGGSQGKLAAFSALTIPTPSTICTLSECVLPFLLLFPPSSQPQIILHHEKENPMNSSLFSQDKRTIGGKGLSLPREKCSDIERLKEISHFSFL